MVPEVVEGRGHIAGAGHVADGGYGDAGGQLGGDFGHLLFAHAVDEEVGLAVHQDGAANGVGPVVVVGEAAQAGLDAADDEGDVLPQLTDAAGVDEGGPLGAQAGAAAGGVIVIIAVFLGGGVFVEHRVEVAGGHQHAQAGLAQPLEVDGGAPVGLGDDAHPPATLLQEAADDGRAEAGMVYIGVAADEEEVEAVPAALVHLGAGDGQEVAGHFVAPLSVSVMKKGCLIEQPLICQRCGPGVAVVVFAGKVRVMTSPAPPRRPWGWPL